MNLPIATDCLVADDMQTHHGGCVGHTHLFGHIADAVDSAIPYDILYIDVVANERLAVVVDVDDTYQSVTVLSEIVNKGGVLPKGEIGIVGIILGRLVVAKEQDDTVAYQFFEFCASTDIGFFCEHTFK